MLQTVFSAVVICALARGKDDEIKLVVGVYGSMTSVSFGYLASAIAADLDFKKNLNETIKAILGDPIVPIPKLNPCLRPRMLIGNHIPSSS